MNLLFILFFNINLCILRSSFILCRILTLKHIMAVTNVKFFIKKFLVIIFNR